jgi:tetratricopeptide (TPR) repeat protein
MNKIKNNFLEPSKKRLISLIEHYKAGKFADAEKLSLSITQDFPKHQFAWKMLAAVLKLNGKINKSLVASQRSVELGPLDCEAHNNLGITLEELGRLEEAEVSYRQAIKLKPDLGEAHNNLGITLKKLGRLKEAEASYRQAIKLKPNYAEAHSNLSNNLSYMNDIEKEINALKNILNLDDDNYKLAARVNLALCNFLEGNFAESKRQVLAAEKIQKKTAHNFKFEKIYQRYLLKILKWHEDKYLDVNKEKKNKKLYVIGESHTLTSHHLSIQHSGIEFFCKAKLIKGCMQWHLGNASRNEYKNKFESIFCSLPKYSHVLLAIGEIDCRLDSGIIQHKKKYPVKQIKEIIRGTVKNYLSYIVVNNSNCQHKIIIQGVPCPTINRCFNYSEKEVKQLIEVIKLFNFELKIRAEEKKLGFLDVHKFTDRGDGFSNNIWHIDKTHISPEGMIKVWNGYTC